MELRLALAVGLLAVPTARTSAGSVPRIDEDHRHARPLGLVMDKLRQLVESPVAQQPAHLTRETVAPLPDTLQVFESECLARGLCAGDELLGNAVVGVPNKARLPALDPLEVSPGRLG